MPPKKDTFLPPALIAFPRIRPDPKKISLLYGRLLPERQTELIL